MALEASIHTLTRAHEYIHTDKVCGGGARACVCEKERNEERGEGGRGERHYDSFIEHEWYKHFSFLHTYKEKYTHINRKVIDR